MATDRHPEIQKALEHAVEKLDVGGVILRLVEIAVKKRDAEEALDKPNRAEVRFWQATVELLHETEEKLEAL